MSNRAHEAMMARNQTTYRTFQPQLHTYPSRILECDTFHSNDATYLHTPHGLALLIECAGVSDPPQWTRSGEGYTLAAGIYFGPGSHSFAVEVDDIGIHAQEVAETWACIHALEYITMPHVPILTIYDTELSEIPRSTTQSLSGHNMYDGDRKVNEKGLTGKTDEGLNGLTGVVIMIDSIHVCESMTSLIHGWRTSGFINYKGHKIANCVAYKRLDDLITKVEGNTTQLISRHGNEGREVWEVARERGWAEGRVEGKGRRVEFWYRKQGGTPARGLAMDLITRLKYGLDTL